MRERARAGRGDAERATDREVNVVAAVIAVGSEKAAVHRLGLSHSTGKHHLANARSKVGATTTAQLLWILGPRLPDAERGAHEQDQSGAEQVTSRRTAAQWSSPVDLVSIDGEDALLQVARTDAPGASGEGGR
ncbi:MAG: hypothetical protein ABIZ34_09720 [Candidatus Limnocylindrales bacterium]